MVAGLAVAAAAYACRYSILAWQAFKARPPALRRFYEGGFQSAMSRREAALILGVRYLDPNTFYELIFTHLITSVEYGKCHFGMHWYVTELYFGFGNTIRNQVYLHSNMVNEMIPTVFLFIFLKHFAYGNT